MVVSNPPVPVTWKERGDFMVVSNPPVTGTISIANPPETLGERGDVNPFCNTPVPMNLKGARGCDGNFQPTGTGNFGGGYAICSVGKKYMLLTLQIK